MMNNDGLPHERFFSDPPEDTTYLVWLDLDNRTMLAMSVGLLLIVSIPIGAVIALIWWVMS